MRLIQDPHAAFRDSVWGLEGFQPPATLTGLHQDLALRSHKLQAITCCDRGSVLLYLLFERLLRWASSGIRVMVIGFHASTKRSCVPTWHTLQTGPAAPSLLNSGSGKRPISIAKRPYG